MKKLYLMFIVVATTLISCKKIEHLDQPPATVKNYQLDTIRSINSNGHHILQTYIYNQSGSLKSEIIKDETTGVVVSQNYYYQGGVLEHSVVKAGEKEISKIFYYYSSNQLHKIDYLELDAKGNGSLNFSKRLVYHNKILKSIFTYSNHYDILYYENLIYNNDGNIIESNIFSANNEIQYKSTYSYDNKINPYLNQPTQGEFALELSRNNIIHSRHLNYKNPFSNFEIRFEYTYNNRNYPTERWIKGQIGQQGNTSYTYNILK